MLGKRGPQISDDPQAEQRLLSQLMSSGVPDAIYFKDLRRRFVRLNEAECKILGIASPCDVIGQTADRLVSGKRARMWRREELDVLVTGNPLIDRVEKVMHDDGAVQWLSATKVAMRNNEGATVGLVGITRDITQHKLHERLKEQFISTVSHELRTPATAIMGSLSLVRSGAAGTLPKPAAHLIEIAGNNCQRLVHLINDILDLEKIEAGMMAFDLKPVDVRTLLKQEVEAIESFAGPYGVQVRLETTDAPAMVRADPDRLAQVVSNLLSNAVKFSPRGAEVVVGIEEAQGNCRIWVRDHGPGIPETFKKRIFDKFVQVAANEKNNKSGTGLGLSVVKQIVERLKGEVGFKPAPGGGTIFWITLPRLQESQEDRVRPAEAAKRSAGA